MIIQLRKSGVVSPITVTINGNLHERHSHEERSLFIAKLAEIPNVNVVGFRSLTPLSRMWNLGIQASDTDITIVLNDDLAVNPKFAQADIANLASAASRHNLALGSLGRGIAWGSFSFFAISKRCVSKVGWFDERFVGFGEEDGDYLRRYLTEFSEEPPSVVLNGLINLDDPSTSGHEKGTGKYSLANRAFGLLKAQLREEYAIEGPGEQKFLGRYEFDPHPLWALHQQIPNLLKMKSDGEVAEVLRPWVSPQR
jgi:hypothetical protein